MFQLCFSERGLRNEKNLHDDHLWAVGSGFVDLQREQHEQADYTYPRSSMSLLDISTRFVSSNEVWNGNTHVHHSENTSLERDVELWRLEARRRASPQYSASSSNGFIPVYSACFGVNAAA